MDPIDFPISAFADFFAFSRKGVGAFDTDFRDDEEVKVLRLLADFSTLLGVLKSFLPANDLDGLLSGERCVTW